MITNKLIKSSITTTPEVVVYQGQSISIIKDIDSESGQVHFFYSILTTQLNNQATAEYKKLPMPDEQSILGYNLLRTPAFYNIEIGCFQLLTDQKYIYLFFNQSQTLYACRYLLKEVTGENGIKSFILEPAWEVRFKRSKKPDTPYSETDVSDFTDMMGQPFIEPLYALPLGNIKDEFEIENGEFSMELVPTARPDEYRWYLFVVNSKTSSMLLYSFASNSEGWLQMSTDQFDNQKNHLKSDCRFELYVMEDGKSTDFLIKGIPSTTIYNKKEPVSISGDEQINLNSSYKLKLMVPVYKSTDENRQQLLADINFCIDENGYLIYPNKTQDTDIARYEAGFIEPMDYSAMFNGGYITMASLHPDIIQPSFIQQLWVYPQNTDTKKHYLIGSSTGQLTEQPLSTLWIESQKRIGFGYSTIDGNKYEGCSTEDVLTLNVWNNIILRFDGKQYELFVNGSSVNVTQQTPEETPVEFYVMDTLGTHVIDGTRFDFKGCIDDLRIWKDSMDINDLMGHMYREMTDEEIEKHKDELLIYWKFCEGCGEVIENDSSYKEKMNGKMLSASWKSSNSPIKTSFEPKTHIDKNNFLSLEAGIIDSSKLSEICRQFGKIDVMTRLQLLNSADGRIHAYYKGVDSHFYKAIYDPYSVKAIFSIPCKGKCEESHFLNFISRGSGSTANMSRINIERESNNYLCAISVTDGMGYTEKWKGVPVQTDKLIDILNGNATLQPTTENKNNDFAFYDYSGKLNIAYQEIGEKGSQMLFISGTNPALRITKIESRSASNRKLDVSFTLLTANAENICVFHDVPNDADLFLLTLRGFNSSYTYEASHYKIIENLDLYQMGVSGEVGEFTCMLTNSQGVEVQGGILDASTGSNLFVAYSNQSAANAHYEQIDFGKGNALKAEQKKIGQDGGWMSQSPKKEIFIPFEATLNVPVDNPLKARFYQMPGDVTMETWIRGGNALVEANAEHEYQHIFHAHPFEEISQSAYMIGIAPSVCMRMMYRTIIETSNCSELFATGVYSIICYIKPDLNTLKYSDQNNIYTRKANEQNYEKLTIDKQGQFCFTIVKNGEKKEMKKTFQHDSEKWIMVSMVRNNKQAKVYLNDQLATSIEDAPVFTGTSESFCLGKNISPSLFECCISNLSIWNRALDQDELINRHMQYTVPDASGLQLLWELNSKAKETINVAKATMGKFNGKISNGYIWKFPGLFQRAFGAAGCCGLISRNALIDTEQWTHIAFCRQMGYGIRTGGNTKAYAQCATSPAFNTSSGFTIEGWVRNNRDKKGREILFSKYGSEDNNQSFEFGFNGPNSLLLNVRLTGSNNTTQLCTLDVLINQAELTFLTVTANIESRNTKNGNNEEVTQKYLCVSFYQDGKKIKSSEKSLGKPIPVTDEKQVYYSIATSQAPVCLGRTRSDGSETEQAFFTGEISSFAFFSNALDEYTVNTHYIDQSQVVLCKSLISYWRFNEQEGVVAIDCKGKNNLGLSEAGLWTTFPEISSTYLLVNGQALPTDKIDIYSLGGYGDNNQVRFGNQLREGVLNNIFSGEINEFRLWKIARTRQQIAENLYSYLTGTENGLNAYWTFESETGAYAPDMSGNGNHAFLIKGDNGYPEWRNSDAPQNDEIPFIINAIGGKPDSKSVLLTGGIAVMEFACTQFNAYNTAYSLMKRAYVYSEMNALTLNSGFKIGDLKRIYMGQVQSDPSIIGFIEGTPPIPSENLTRPYHADPSSSDYFAYNDCSSITLTEEKGLEVSLSSSKQKQDTSELSIDDYLLTHVEVEYSLGLIEKNQFAEDIRIGGHIDESEDDDTKGDSSSVTTRLTSTISNQLSNRGNWEKLRKDGTYLLGKERRFIPSNEGMALVKSSTVDTYMLLLEKTNAMVGLEYELNQSIPEDFNYISFPINPYYTKNGTLDGKVGLENDESYPGADKERGSYFKPIESYTLKKNIERENNKLAAYYAQFNVGKPTDLEKNDKIVKKFDTIKYYDDVKETFKKDIVNEYIWTAGGGFYSQSDNYVSSLQESYTGSFSKGQDDTAGITIELSCFIGFKIENTCTNGHHWTLNIEKSKSSENSIGLDLLVQPEANLGYYDELTGEYTDSVPGKVDTYRFNAFYQASNKSNFNALFSTVIDRNWLENSSDSRAKALRQAQNIGGSPYRIFYRVTYVNRVTPSFQNFPFESSTIKKCKPTDCTSNNLLLSMIDEFCKNNPKPALDEIGDAVRYILEKVLCKFIPGWDNFLEKSQVNNTDEFICMTQLIDDTTSYMIQYYDTLNL